MPLLEKCNLSDIDAVCGGVSLRRLFALAAAQSRPPPAPGLDQSPNSPSPSGGSPASVSPEAG